MSTPALSTTPPATAPLLIELLIEELPPKALKTLGESFAQTLHQSLITQNLCSTTSTHIGFASPRRLAVLIQNVAAVAPNQMVLQKLMPVAVGLTTDNTPTPALLKKLAHLGIALNIDTLNIDTLNLKQESGTLFLDTMVQGATLAHAAQLALTEALAKLPIPKVMQYQLSRDCDLPGWSSVSFVRPAHRLVALHGSAIVPIKALGLSAGRTTQGHRFEATMPYIELAHANDYEATLSTQGAVIPSFAKRQALIVAQLHAAARHLGDDVSPIDDAALLDEVTALVERPNVLVCGFDPAFLSVPPECLILTMKANQKYFPLLKKDKATGQLGLTHQLTHQFLVVSNITPANPSAVIEGNERVVRPRLADAKFFFDQDRKKTLASRVPSLDKVVYHNKLGTQGERVARVAKIAQGIGTLLGGQDLAIVAKQAATLAKADLLTDMVGEFPELQGIMGRYYAIHDGEALDVADAIEDHYKPKFAGDTLPRGRVGVVLALADKLETLVGLFGIGALPTGDKDPFALRRHALGVYRLLCEIGLACNFTEMLDIVEPTFNFIDISNVRGNLNKFMLERITNYHSDKHSLSSIDAVLNLNPKCFANIPLFLEAIKHFATLPEAPALAAANKRVSNILKKVTGTISTEIAPELLREPAEQALYAALQSVAPQAARAFEERDYTASLQALAALKTPIDAFFETVMVNADEAALRANRQALLAKLHHAMNQVADLSKLAP